MKNFEVVARYTNGCEKYWLFHNMEAAMQIAKRELGWDDVEWVTINDEKVEG